MKVDLKKEGDKASAKTKEMLRALPKVDDCLRWLGNIDDVPPLLVKNAVREILAELRAAILAGQKSDKGTTFTSRNCSLVHGQDCPEAGAKPETGYQRHRCSHSYQSRPILAAGGGAGDPRRGSVPVIPTLN